MKTLENTLYFSYGPIISYVILSWACWFFCSWEDLAYIANIFKEISWCFQVKHGRFLLKQAETVWPEFSLQLCNSINQSIDFWLFRQTTCSSPTGVACNRSHLAKKHVAVQQLPQSECQRFFGLIVSTSVCHLEHLKVCLESRLSYTGVWRFWAFVGRSCCGHLFSGCLVDFSPLNLVPLWLFCFCWAFFALPLTRGKLCFAL